MWFAAASWLQPTQSQRVLLCLLMVTRIHCLNQGPPVMPLLEMLSKQRLGVCQHSGLLAKLYQLVWLLKGRISGRPSQDCLLCTVSRTTYTSFKNLKPLPYLPSRTGSSVEV